MSLHINYLEWNSAGECLSWLFENHRDMKIYGHLHLWQESFATLGGNHLAGSYKPITPKMLENRSYSVLFLDNSVGIRFHDQIFAPEIPNRKYPEKTHCVLLMLPTI